MSAATPAPITQQPLVARSCHCVCHWQIAAFAIGSFSCDSIAPPRLRRLPGGTTPKVSNLAHPERVYKLPDFIQPVHLAGVSAASLTSRYLYVNISLSLLKSAYQSWRVSETW